MARRIIHQLVDDIDGAVLDDGAGETASFALDGRSYEIDLSESNAQSLRDALQPWIDAGRRVSAAGAGRGRRGGGRGQSTRQRGTAGGRDLAAVRAWAKENGHQVSDRSRVLEAVLQAYDAAH